MGWHKVLFRAFFFLQPFHLLCVFIVDSYNTFRDTGMGCLARDDTLIRCDMYFLVDLNMYILFATQMFVNTPTYL